MNWEVKLLDTTKWKSLSSFLDLRDWELLHLGRNLAMVGHAALITWHKIMQVQKSDTDQNENKQSNRKFGNNLGDRAQ